MKVLAPAAAAPAVVVMPPPAPAAAVPPTPAGSDDGAAAPAPAPPVAAPAPAAAAAPADPRLRVGRAVRKKFAGSGWFDGSVTSVADGSFEVRWSDGDENAPSRRRQKCSTPPRARPSRLLLLLWRRRLPHGRPGGPGRTVRAFTSEAGCLRVGKAGGWGGGYEQGRRPVGSP